MAIFRQAALLGHGGKNSAAGLQVGMIFTSFVGNKILGAECLIKCVMKLRTAQRGDQLMWPLTNGQLDQAIESPLSLIACTGAYCSSG
jgi:hypothetical protein